MYYYLYNKSTGKIDSSCDSADVISINGNDELAIINSETNYDIYTHKVRISDLTIVEDQEIIQQNKEFKIRQERHFLLVNDVDPIVTNPIRWGELTSDKQAEWTQYRIDLLNVPQQSGFPNDITWPTKP